MPRDVEGEGEGEGEGDAVLVDDSMCTALLDLTELPLEHNNLVMEKHNEHLFDLG